MTMNTTEKRAKELSRAVSALGIHPRPKPTPKKPPSLDFLNSLTGLTIPKKKLVKPFSFVARVEGGVRGTDGAPGKDAVVDHEEIYQKVLDRFKKEKSLVVSDLKDGQAFVFNNTKYQTSEMMHGGGSSDTTDPAGNDTDIQFNDAGSFGGEDTLTFDKTTNTVTLGVEDSTAVFKGADASTTSTPGGTVEVRGGEGSTNDIGGEARLIGGEGGPTGNGSNAEVVGGDAGGGNGNGGNALLQGGAKSGAGTDGKIQLLDASSGESAFLSTSSLSADRTFTFPNASGTFALNTAGVTFVDNEVVAGATNTFTLANTPILGSQHIYGNGQRLTPGGVDYTIAGAVVTTSNSFSAGQILADYRK